MLNTVKIYWADGSSVNPSSEQKQNQINRKPVRGIFYLVIELSALQQYEQSLSIHGPYCYTCQIYFMYQVDPSITNLIENGWICDPWDRLKVKVQRFQAWGVRELVVQRLDTAFVVRDYPKGLCGPT